MMNEKEALEYYAVENFVTEYNKAHEIKLRFQQLRKPPEPDAICLLDDNELGVEVAHLYGRQLNDGSSIDAERILGRKRKNPRTEQEEMNNRTIPLNERVVVPLNKILKDKASKSYSRSPVWLLVRNAFPLWGKDNFQRYFNEIIVPEVHPFDQIWLLCQRDADLIRLQ